MQSNFVSESGARWMRCDLHVHSPFDNTKKFGEDVRQVIDKTGDTSARTAEIAKKFVSACNAAKLDLVALTDHNSIDGYRHLKPHFDNLTRSERSPGLEMPVILPGVEFSVGGERPISLFSHFLHRYVWFRHREGNWTCIWES